MVIDIAVRPEEEIEESVTMEEEPADVTPKTGPPRPEPLVIGLTVVMVVSVVVVFFGAFAFGLSGLQEQRSQHQLYAEFRGLLDPSSTVAPEIGGAIPQGFPIALINSSQAGLHNVVVVEGTTSGDLLAGPGHLPDTPLPGQVGDSVLVGKGSTSGAPFGDITSLHKGDVITVRTGESVFHFTVEDQRLAGSRKPSYRSDSGLLTLVTSTGSGPLGRVAPDHLVYVDAKLQGKAVGSPPGRPTDVSSAELQGHSDWGAWPWVLVWLAALGAGSAACWYLWSRLGILRAWLICAPVLLAILWGLSDEAIRLLPNVY